ncbi:chromobox protein homolog 5-like [Aphis gossypii]|uniref:chromobox protein homolog 5-like n=1 Tax=Aphis gossypii TaxID=80765 RepID=UPI00215941A9|nr:chromobox protein homolog 5-like [Aphis gossypii]
MTDVMSDRKKYDPDKDIFINGYECGLIPWRILAVVEIRGVRYCLVKWKDTEDPSYVTHKFARDKFPLILVIFYERLAIQFLQS